MKLYDLRAGLNPRRVRIFLAEKGIEIAKAEVDMLKGENQTPEFLAINPLGTLPVLELDDGTILTESIAICRYIEELYPEPSMFGRNPLERAQVEMWNRRAELELLRPVTDAFVHLSDFWQGRRTQLPDYGEMVRQQALQRMQWFDEVLADREFLITDTYTVADITMQCALLVGKNTGTRIPEQCENLSRYFASLSSRATARA